MTITQLAAVVGPAVVLVTLAVRAGRWLVRTAQRITDLERRLARLDQALSRIGAALHDDD